MGDFFGDNVYNVYDFQSVNIELIFQKKTHILGKIKRFCNTFCPTFRCKSSVFFLPAHNRTAL